MKTHTRTAAGTSSRSGYTSMSYVCAPSTRSRNGTGVPIAPERPALADVTAADRWRSSSPPWGGRRELFGRDELLRALGLAPTGRGSSSCRGLTLAPDPRCRRSPGARSWRRHGGRWRPPPTWRAKSMKSFAPPWARQSPSCPPHVRGQRLYSIDARRPAARPRGGLRLRLAPPDGDRSLRPRSRPPRVLPRSCPAELRARSSSLRRAGVPRLPHVRRLRPRLPASPLRPLPPGSPRRLQLPGPRVPGCLPGGSRAIGPSGTGGAMAGGGATPRRRNFDDPWCREEATSADDVDGGIAVRLGVGRFATSRCGLGHETSLRLQRRRRPHRRGRALPVHRVAALAGDRQRGDVAIERLGADELAAP